MRSARNAHDSIDSTFELVVWNAALSAHMCIVSLWDHGLVLHVYNSLTSENLTLTWLEKSVRGPTDKRGGASAAANHLFCRCSAKSACWGVANELFSSAPGTANHNDVDTAVINELILYCVVTDHECVPCAATPAPLAFQGVVLWCVSSRRTADVAVRITETIFETTTSSR